MWVIPTVLVFYMCGELETVFGYRVFVPIPFLELRKGDSFKIPAIFHGYCPFRCRKPSRHRSQGYVGSLTSDCRIRHGQIIQPASSGNSRNIHFDALGAPFPRRAFHRCLEAGILAIRPGGSPALADLMNRRKIGKVQCAPCGLAIRLPSCQTLSRCVFYHFFRLSGNVANFNPAMKYQQKYALVITDFFKDES